jgi:hypothetical protein
VHSEKFAAFNVCPLLERKEFQSMTTETSSDSNKKTQDDTAQNLPVDYWKVFATAPGQALLQQIAGVIDAYERPRLRRPLKKNEYEGYMRLIHALAANLAYLQILQQTSLKTKSGLYVSRSKRVLGKRAAKHTSAPTFLTERLIRLLDTFASTDLIRQIVPTAETRGRIQRPFAKHRRYGDSTVIYPTGRFVKFMAAHAVKSLDDVTRHAVGEEIVLLKSLRADGDDFWSDASEVDYPDNAIADGYREVLRQIQQRLDAASMIVIHENKPSTTTGMLIDPRMRRLRRVFTRERWDSCGRYYGAWWIPLSKEERLTRIVLDGHRVVELDFSSMMVRLAYGMVKVEPPAGDQYAVPGFEKSRDCMKVLFSALLFDKPGYNRKKLPKDALKGLHKDEERPAPEIIHALREYHKPLAGLFGSGVGHDLFFQESQVLTTILLRLNVLGIVGLPVHDALYVPSNRVEETKRVMEEVFLELVGMRGVVRVSAL